MPIAEQRGGAEKMLQDLLSAKGEVSWHVVFLESGPMVDWAVARRIPATVVDAGHLRQLHRFLATIRTVVRIIRETNSELVLSWMTKAHLYGGVAAKIARVKAVWWQHGIPKGDWMDRIASLIPAAWVGCSSHAVCKAQERLPGSPMGHVVYPGIDLAAFDANLLSQSDSVRGEFNICETRILIGTVARLQRGKGVHVLLRAIAEVQRLFPVHLLVVGGPHFSEPEYPGELESLAQELGLGDSVTFAGQRHDIPRLVNALDIFVHAATASEAFGIAIVEAMNLGKPVIATATGGPEEIVQDHKTGLLVAPGDIAELSRALVELMTDPLLGRSLAQEARKATQERFAGTRMATEIVSLLRMTVTEIGN